MSIPVLLFTILILIVACICQLIGFFAVLFTGKWPASIRGWVLKGLNATVRMDAYVMLLTDVYPPFSTESTASEGALDAHWMRCAHPVTVPHAHD